MIAHWEMQDGGPMRLDKGNKNLKSSTPAITLGAFIFITSFVILKHVMLPNITMWYSHILSIVVTTTMVAFFSVLLNKKMMNLQRNHEKAVLENTIAQKELKERLEKEIEDKKHIETIWQTTENEWGKTFDAIDDWICMIDLDSTIQRTNIAAEKYFGRIRELIGQKCCKLAHGTDKPLDECPLPIMLKTGKRESVEIQIKDGRWMMITVDPVFDDDGRMIKAVHIARDITQRIKIQHERERLLLELQKNRATLDTLSGLIPICSQCKKIRDDKGYWNQLESYIHNHTGVDFSHGICPECAKKLYPDLDLYKD